MKNGNLLFIKNNRTEIIKQDLPFALLQYLKRKLSKDAQFANGGLKIVANYKKEYEQTKPSKYDDYLRNN